MTRQVKFSFLGSDTVCEGYEIHMGTTIPVEDTSLSPLNTLEDSRTDGYFLNEKCFGTYIHGILDNGAVIDYLLAPYAAKLSDTPFDFKAFKEEQYNKLADHVRSHVDMELVYKIIN